MTTSVFPPASLQRLLVGGAVRDALLGLPVRERDWLVLGQTPESMVAAGFEPVGRDFPVFLHPTTKEEHALARTERKNGRGYHGFQFHTGPDVTVEEDLARRDLTINAMAQDSSGELVDPFGGRADLDARVLRHVSPAFAEDPLRILRVARFAAKFAPLGFTVHPETLALMRQMVEAGEADALIPERVWKETEKALDCERPSVFFKVLHACGALARVMPELAALDGVPQPAAHHPEVDTLVHVMMCVDYAAKQGFDRSVRVATLLHDLGKGLTPAEELPSHRGHEESGVPLVQAFCERLRVPSLARDLAVVVCREHLRVHRAPEMRPGKLLDLLESLGAFRFPVRFEMALQACECDARGRLGLEDRPYASPDDLRWAAAAAAAVPVSEVVAAGFEGAAIGEELKARRLRSLSAWKGKRGLSVSAATC